jgi:hypothetical protein
VLFNEVPQDTAEFRFFTEEILESHASQDLYVINAGSKKVTQKMLGSADTVAEVRKVFMIN